MTYLRSFLAAVMPETFAVEPNFCAFRKHNYLKERRITSRCHQIMCLQLQYEAFKDEVRTKYIYTEPIPERSVQDHSLGCFDESSRVDTRKLTICILSFDLNNKS